MFSKNKTNGFTNGYWDSVRQAVKYIKNADCILVGIGSGMTAAGGLCYTDASLVRKWYSEYYKLGKKSIIEIMSDFWVTTINKDNAAAYWGFWARHIYHIRYEAEALQPYTDLFRLIRDKRHFICSTNVDGQLEKVGFDKNIIFAPQGDYALFQCSKPCSHEVYNNENMIDIMISNMVSPFEINSADIPFCPHCGSYLIPNLRCDYNFVEKPHIQNAEQYEQFLTDVAGNQLLLLELGVGFNTPGIIRFPFETIALQNPNSFLIRVNLTNVSIPEKIADRGISIKDDIEKFLHNILCEL